MNKNKIVLKYNCPRNDRTFKGFLWISVSDRTGGSFVKMLNDYNMSTYEGFAPRWLSYSESEALAGDIRYVDKLFSFSTCLECTNIRKFKKFLRKHPELVGKCTLVHTLRYANESLGFSLDVNG